MINLVTVKSALLPVLYFPSLDRVFGVFVTDSQLIVKCLLHSARLLLSGYFAGAIAGIICGIAIGFSKTVNYWLMPIVRVMEPIPSTSWIPLVLVIFPSAVSASSFLIAIAVWFPTTIMTSSGISNVQNTYFEVSQTLGAGKWAQIFQVGVPAAMPHMFATLMSGCCDAGNQLIAIDPESDFIVKVWLEQEGKSALQNGEVIVGNALGKKEGEITRYYNREFRIKAVLEETGMGYDNSVFITYQDAYAIAAESMYAAALPFSPDEDRVSSILIKLEDGYTISEVKENISIAYGKDEISVYSSGELTGVLTKQFQAYQIYGTWFEWIFVIMAAISIFAVYIINISQRYREFACMSSIGFTFRQIITMLLEELAVNVLLAGIAGSVVTGVFFTLFRLAIRNLVSVPFILPNIGTCLAIGFYVIFLNVVVSMIAYLYAILRLRNTELASLVKEEN